MFPPSLTGLHFSILEASACHGEARNPKMCLSSSFPTGIDFPHPRHPATPSRKAIVRLVLPFMGDSWLAHQM